MTNLGGIRTDVELYAALLQGRMRGSEALEASQQLLHVLMDSSVNAVFWKDLDSRYLGCNHVFANFAGSEPDALIGKSDLDMPWADDVPFGAEWFLNWDAQVAATGESLFGITERLRRANGELRWVETNKVPLRNLSGEVIGIMGTFEDVTERRAAQERLEQTLTDLDLRVQRRTKDLERAIESLRREVDDRVRVQAEERQQRAYAEALRDTASAMSKTLDVQEVMAQALIGIERLVSNDLTAIMLFGADDTLEVARGRVGFGYQASLERRPGDAPLSAVTQLETTGDVAIVNEPATSFGPAGSTLGAVMRIGDQTVGCVVLESVTAGYFTAAHAERLQAIADLAAASISNARLASQVSELAATEVRQRLSRELHDAVSQTLWTVSLTADSLLREVEPDTALYSRLERLRQLSRGAQAEMRTLLLELRPDELIDVELSELLEQLITAMECRKKMSVSVRISSVGTGEAQRVALYRIAQEALTNVIRHSAATKVVVQLGTLATPAPTAQLRISDNGRGFDVDASTPGHLGLSIMNERAIAAGGTFTLRSTIGEGTTITVTVPVTGPGE